MSKLMGRVPAALIVSGMSVGLVASGMSSAAAVDTTPRVTSGACETLAQEGYVIGDGVTSPPSGDEFDARTTCRIKANGMWQFSKIKKKKKKRVKVKTSFKKLRSRGDARRYAIYTFTKGNKVIKKRVRIRNNRANVKITLPKYGTWSVRARYKGKTITSTLTLAK